MVVYAQKWFIILLSVITLLAVFVLYWGTYNNPSPHALASMALGFLMLWVYVGGYFMYTFRESIRTIILKLPGRWQLKFVLFATCLALIEESITVTMTNLAPLFGVQIGEAYITASTNYLDVVFLHSVVVFVPFFIALSLLLTRYQFSAFSVFIFFGIVGIIAETMFSGNISTLVSGFQWILVYGLMVYLPAYSIPEERGAHRPHWWHYLFAVPYLFILAAPLVVPIVLFITNVLHHPSIHFAPIL